MKRWHWRKCHQKINQLFTSVQTSDSAKDSEVVSLKSLFWLLLIILIDIFHQSVYCSLSLLSQRHRCFRGLRTDKSRNVIMRSENNKLGSPRQNAVHLNLIGSYPFFLVCKFRRPISSRPLPYTLQQKAWSISGNMDYPSLLKNLFKVS